MATKKKTANGQRSMADLHSDVRLIGEALERYQFERQHAVWSLLAAFVTQEHWVGVGPAGTGKSEIVEALFSCLAPDVRHVERQLTKFMPPDELFGPIDLVELQQNKQYTRCLKNGVASCEALTLEEVFDGSEAALRSLLTLIQSRRYEDSAGRVEAPLRMCAGATNFFPEAVELQAFYDRFLFREYVDDIQEDANLESLLLVKAGQSREQQAFRPPCQITLEEWDRIRQAVEKVTIPRGIVRKLMEFRKLVQDQGVRLSPRRCVKLLRALKAAAWLDGKREVEVDHMQILRFICWDTPEQRDKILALVNTLERSEVKEVVEQIDEALRKFRNRPNDPVAAAQQLNKLSSDIRTVLHGVKARLDADEFGKAGTPKVERRLGELQDAHEELTRQLADAFTI